MAYLGSRPCANAVADLGSDPNSARQLSNCRKRIPELGSDPNSAGHAGGASVCVTHRSFGNATSHQQPLATKTGLADSVTCAHAAADLGSDPNSARQFSFCRKRIPELGSDPNSAGHAEFAPQAGFSTRSDKVTIKVWPNRPNTGIRRGGQMGERWRAERSFTITSVASSAYPISARGQNHPQAKLQEHPAAMARRIGVRAQFADTPPAAWSAPERIGIRPQICYRMPELGAEVRAQFGVTPPAALSAPGRIGVRPQICYRVAELVDINLIAVSAYPIRDGGINHHQAKVECRAQPAP